jgi:hypothetical protein
MMSDRIIRGGPVRARDLRASIKELGFEMGTTVVLERALDEFTTLRQNMSGAIDIIQRIVDQMDELMVIGVGMRDQINKLKRERDISDEVTHGDQ